MFSSDTICDLGGTSELANYGEYSGAPSEQQTYDYAKTILSLMCKETHPDGRMCSVLRDLYCTSYTSTRRLMYCKLGAVLATGIVQNLIPVFDDVPFAQMSK